MLIALRKNAKANSSISSCLCRNISYTKPTSKQYHLHKKFRAYPFVMTPETAQRRMAKTAQFLTGGSHWVTSRVAQHLPRKWKFLDFKRPHLFVPLYFSAWIAGGVVTLPMNIRGSEEYVTYISKSTYIPGSDLPELSTASLWPSELKSVEPSPFTDEFLDRQVSFFGEGSRPIEIVKFNVSPVSLLHKSPIFNSQRFYTVNKDIRFLSTDANRNKQAVIQNVQEFFAMPVFLPIYVATYQDEGPDPGPPLILFIQAHSPEGLIHTSQAHVAYLREKNNLGRPSQQFTTGPNTFSYLGQTRRANGSIIRSANASFTEKDSLAFEHYLNKVLGSSKFIGELASMTTKATANIDHSLVREMSGENLKANDIWFDTNLEKIKEFHSSN